jgi:transposase, IS6 family
MLLLDSSVCGLFKWRQFEPEVILLAIGWYCASRFRTATSRSFWPSVGSGWITSPSGDGSSGMLRNWSGERRLRRHLKPTNDSWRVDETYVRVKGKWVYLYRAVDSSGATIDFLLSAKRDAVTAQRFLSKALGGQNHPEPRVINTDKHAAYPPAIAVLQAADDLADNCQHRPRCSISITSWNRITGRSSVGSTRASISARSGVRRPPSPVTKRFI